MRRIPVYERTPIGGLVSSGEDLASHPHLDQVVEASQAAQHGGGPAREGSLSSLKEKRPSAQPYVIESTFGGQASSQQASSFDRIQGGDRRVSIEETGTPIRSHPYMHVRPEDRAASLNEAIDRFGERVAPLLGISFGDFAHPAIKSALPNMTVVGRIVVDSTTATHAQRHGKGRPPSAGEGDGGGASLEERAQWEPLRLTPDNILLETSRQIGSGVRVPLEVSQASVALFPGQLVVLEGCNTSGKMFQVSSQKNPSLSGTHRHAASENGGPAVGGRAPIAPERELSIFVAAGPYTSDSLGPTRGGALDWGHFERLLNVIHETNPHVAILMGPFVADPVLADGAAPSIGTIPAERQPGGPGQSRRSYEELPEDLFRKEILRRLRTLHSRRPALEVILVPSPEDILADAIFPQAPLPASLLEGICDDGRVRLLSNPSTVTIDGVRVAISSADGLFPLGMSEYFTTVASPSSASTEEGGLPVGDRMHRLASHIVSGQACLYPVSPSPLLSAINIDPTRMHLAALQEAPDILLMASQLRFFSRTIQADGADAQQPCVFVNPGRFCRKRAPGSAALIRRLPALRGGESSSRIDFYQF